MILWYTPLWPPHYINFLKSILFLASDSSSGSVGVFHISLRPQKKYNRESRRKKKNKWTIWTWVSSKCKKGRFVWPCIPRASVDYCGHVFFAKPLQKGTNNVDIFSRWLARPLCSSSGFSSHLSDFCWLWHSLDSSFKADRSPLPSVVDCLSASPFDSCPSSFSWTCLFSPLPVLSEISSSGLGLGFTPKQTKRLSAWRTHPIVSQFESK